MYDPPLTKDQIVERYGDDRARFLYNDPAHKFRMDTGIELVHQEPTREEQERIYNNWLLMDRIRQRKSDKKSKKLFGRTNIDHHEYIMGTRKW